jgi:hypothetical protein
MLRKSLNFMIKHWETRLALPSRLVTLVESNGLNKAMRGEDVDAVDADALFPGLPQKSLNPFQMA